MFLPVSPCPALFYTVTIVPDGFLCVMKIIFALQSTLVSTLNLNHSMKSFSVASHSFLLSIHPENE